MKLNMGYTINAATGRHYCALGTATVRDYLKAVMTGKQWGRVEKVFFAHDKVRHNAR